jgi:hypothetical protein
VRLTLERQSRDELLALLSHNLDQARSSELIKLSLRHILAEKANGNARTLMNLCGNLLDHAERSEATVIDEALFADGLGEKPTRSRGSKN